MAQCEKRVFRSRKEALRFLQRFLSKAAQEAHRGIRDFPEAHARHPYRCPRCGEWHLTSQNHETRP